jgi:hypothetical protein
MALRAVIETVSIHVGGRFDVPLHGRAASQKLESSSAPKSVIRKDLGSGVQAFKSLPKPSAPVPRRLDKSA